mmetsp:Transcript_38073/g.101455  ORF Transcript_38073/g.101455 Transcript_38073/m.101455 type:complete len:695 (-) Transcript_38073:232-2316(-)
MVALESLLGLAPEEVTLENVAEIDDETKQELARNEQPGDGVENIIKMIESEQIEIVSSLHRFMNTVRIHMELHQKKVEGHHWKQLALLKSVSSSAPSNLSVRFSNHSAYVDEEGSKFLEGVVQESLDGCQDDDPVLARSSRRKYTGRCSVTPGDSVLHAYENAQNLARTRCSSQTTISKTISHVFVESSRTSVALQRVVRAGSKLFGIVSLLHRFADARRFSMNWAEALVESPQFKFTTLLLVFANAIIMAVESAHDIQHSFDSYDAALRGEAPTGSTPGWFETADTFFFSIFCLELLLRLLAHEGRFFVGPEWRWNVFDFSVVSLAVAETFLANLVSPTVVRLLRVLKVSRSVRTFRLLRFAPMLYPLRLLLLACKNSWAAVCWSSFLLFVLFLVFGTIFVGGAKTYVDDATFTDPVVADIRVHFGSMPIAMLSLFLSFLGEAEFRGIIELLAVMSFWYCALYLVFVLFMNLAIANVIAGLFVADAMEMASQDRELRERGEVLRARKNMDILSTLFGEIDTTGAGVLYRSDFRKQLQRPEVQALFSHFQFDIIDVDSFFTFLDVDGTGTVSIEEFVVGCLRMNGKSNAIDMEMSIHETKRTVKRLAQDLEEMQEHGAKVHQQLHDISQMLAHVGLWGSIQSAPGPVKDHVSPSYGQLASESSWEDASDMDMTNDSLASPVATSVTEGFSEISG